MVKRWWRILVPTMAAAAAVSAGVSAAVAGELDDDPVNNRLQTRTSLLCNQDGSVTLKWSSIAPGNAVSMTAKWYDATADPDLHHPTPARRADQVVAVHGNTAYGRFRLAGMPDGHTIALFVDAWSQAGGRGEQVFGLGRNLDTYFHCVNGHPTG